MPPVPRRLLVVAAAFLAAALFALSSPGIALAKDWRIDSMDVVLNVQQSGDVLVDETVTFYFEGPFTFVGRVIPTGNLEGIQDIQVFRDGTPLPLGGGPGTYDTFYEGSDLVIQVNFDLQDTAATWTFRYRAVGGIHYFDEGDELRWYVFDAETPVPIRRATATVRLPSAVPSADLTAAIDTGVLVSGTVVSPEPGVLHYEADDFPPYTRFWVVAGFPKGVVDFTWTTKRVAAFVLPRVGFLLPILTFLLMIVIWSKRGRDDPAVVHAKYVTEPPSDLKPAIVGALIDERVEVREVVATIVDLARRGFLEITDETEGSWIFKKSKTKLHRRGNIGELEGYEKRLANGLFRNNEEVVDTDDLKEKFYTYVDPICADIYEEVTTRGFFASDPKTARSRWKILGFVILFGLGGLGILMSFTGVPGSNWFATGGIVSAIVVLAFARSMPQRTSVGAQEQRKWEAFRNYLQDLVRYQDLATARATFEAYLPYAIAFGVEKDWVRRFEELRLPAPTWYHPMWVPTHGAGPVSADSGAPGGLPGGLPGGMPGGLGGLSLESISDGLFGSLNSMSSVLTSKPSSSGKGSGGFGGFGGGFGGGFSGGGGGGGFRAG
jgi:uncharacterized membrane protein YgcG